MTDSPRLTAPVRFFVFWLPVLLWMGVIFFNSTGHGSAENTNPVINNLIRRFLPALAARLNENELYQLDFALRKLAHLIEYAVLGFLLYRALLAGRRGFSRRAAVHTLIIGPLYAVSDEIHQIFVPGRWASPLDVLIDSVGVLVGLALAAWIFRAARKSRNTPLSAS